VTDGFGREIQFFYITYGEITRLNEIREPAPGDVGWYSTFFQYDADGRLVQITNPMGQTTSFTYDGSDRVSSAIDSHGHATEYAYDGSSRVTTITDPADNDTTISYDSSTQRTVTDRLDSDTIYTFDASGRNTRIEDALGNVTEFSWNSTTWEMTQMLGPKIPVSGLPWTRHQVDLAY
jgi:YD repeat-containing protein